MYRNFLTIVVGEKTFVRGNSRGKPVEKRVIGISAGEPGCNLR